MVVEFCRDVGFQSIAGGADCPSWTWGVIRFDSHATGQARIHEVCGIPPAMQILGAAGFPITDLTLSTPGVTVTVASGDDAPPAPPAKRARVIPAHVTRVVPALQATVPTAAAYPQPPPKARNHQNTERNHQNRQTTQQEAKKPSKTPRETIKTIKTIKFWAKAQGWTQNLMVLMVLMVSLGVFDGFLASCWGGLSI
jgi:hypothetical protein